MNVKKMKIIGTLVARSAIPGGTNSNYEIVKIVKDETGKYYITNQWYKEYKQIPLIIHEHFLVEYHGS